MMDRKEPRLRTFLSLLLTSCCGLSAFAVSGPTISAWQQDCVGQFELALPGKVELPIPRWADVIDGRESYAFLPQSTYNGENEFLGTHEQMSLDGVTAWGSKQEIEGSSLFPGPEMTLEDFGVLRQGIAAAQQDIKAEMIARLRPKDAEKLKPVPGMAKDSFVWAYDLDRDVFIWRGGHTFLYQVGGTDEQKIGAGVKRIIENLRARDTFDVPAEPGLCLQGGFLPDRSNPAHVIGVTYRLKEHPEVEIFFRVSAPSTDRRGAKSLRVPEEEVRFFWEANYGADDKQHKLIHPHIPGVVHFPDITIGGYKGKSSFVELMHQDDSIDYGYMAYAMGEAANDRYPPTLMLYVIRTASRAKGEPLSKDQIKEMAEHIAASVRRRPVAP